MIEKILQWYWPRFRRADYSAYFQPAVQVAQPKQPTDKDPHKQFVGYNPNGAVMKARTFEWDMSTGKTEWATIKAYEKGREVAVGIVPTLTGADKLELMRRKPRVSESAAAVIKETFAEKGGATTGAELALVTGYSKAYADVCLAAFRAALLSEQAQNN